MNRSYVIGVDFGTDSARAILVDAFSGEIISAHACLYPRWKQGRYQDASRCLFRQHPLDYEEALEDCLSTVVRACPDPRRILAIGVDTTSSTPCLMGHDGRPLALDEAFAQDPDAMFVLWKDHTALEEAAEITRLSKTSHVDYSAHSGYTYSAENFWSKALHILRTSPRVAAAARGIMEQVDYIPSLLTGRPSPRSLSAAWSKQMFALEWGGYPPRDFFLALGGEPLARLRDSLPGENFPSTHLAGTISPLWASRLGLSTEVRVGVGHVDAHSGAVGAGCRPGTVVLNLGTSACVMAVEPDFRGRILEGVFGQAPGTILPDCEGFEMGLSSFGDNYAWLRRMLEGTMRELLEGKVPEQVLQDASESILPLLARKASRLPFLEDAPLSTDYFNGRRTPRPDMALRATLTGLDLSTDAADLFRSLVEATAFGIRAILEHLERGGVSCRHLVAVGGIARKSPYVVQTLSDVLSRQVAVPIQDDLPSLGAAIHASVVAGCHPDVESAQKALCSRRSETFSPRRDRCYDARYGRYLAL